MKYSKRSIHKYLATNLMWCFFLNLIFTSFDAYQAIFTNGFSFDQVAKGFHLSPFQIFLYIIYLFLFNFIFITLIITLFNLLFLGFQKIINSTQLPLLHYFARSWSSHGGEERNVEKTPKTLLNKLSYIVLPSLIANLGICLFFINSPLTEISFTTIKETNQENWKRKNDLPNIFYIVIDALRADHLSCYGYEKNTSPNIDKIAKEGVIFYNCIAQSSWTIPSTASYFTSLYPTMTGVLGSGDVLDDSFVTLPEVLQKKGWFTAAFSVNPNVSKYTNYNQGFEYFYDRFVTDNTLNFLLRNSLIGKKLVKYGNINAKFSNDVSDTKKRAKHVNKKVFEWLEKMGKKSGLFLYIHYLDPHTPYSPPDHFISKNYSNKHQDKNVPLYDGEIRYIDYHLALLVEKLKELNMLDNSIFLITSDHGEEFRHEHGFAGHGDGFYEATVRVPLIIMKNKYMQITKTIHTQVRLLDIYPTLLDLLGIKITHKIEGISLRGMLSADNYGIGSQVAFMEKTNRDHKGVDVDGEKVKFINGLRIGNKWKLLKYNVINTKQIKTKLFDLEIDSKETKSVTDKSKEVVFSLNQRLNKINNYVNSKTFKAKTKEIEPHIEKELKALGYLQ